MYSTDTAVMALAHAARCLQRCSPQAFSGRFLSTSAVASAPIAIVGSGPSGFYTAKYLLSSDPNITVDMYESLPTPFGACRAMSCKEVLVKALIVQVWFAVGWHRTTQRSKVSKMISKSWQMIHASAS